MPFRFTFDSLLRLRRTQERQQEFVLQRANQRVREALEEMDAIEGELRQIVSARQSPGASHGAEILFDHSRCLVLHSRRAEAERRLHLAREQQALAAQGFQRAWQRREAVEMLRERDRQSYVVAEGRLEQRRQDDLFLQRRRKS